MAWAGWVFDFYDLILYSFLLLPIGREFHFSRAELAWVYGASLLATAIGGIIFGWLSDRFGRRSVLQWTILTFSIGTFASGLAPDLFWLMAARTVTGLGVGGEWATGQTYIGETFPPGVRGRYGAFMQTGAPIGVALAAVMAGFVAPLVGWRGCFFLSGLPALLVLFIRRELPESDIWQEHRRLIAQGALDEAQYRRETAGKFALIFSSEHRVTFIKCLILTIFCMSAYWLTYSWLPGYLEVERHFSLAKSASWILVTQAGGFLGYFSFGFAADKWGRRPAFTAYSVVFAIGLAAVTLFWSTFARDTAVILACMFLVGLGTGVWSGFGPLFAELFPTAIRNTAMGAAYNVARGIQFAAPVAVAALSVRWGLAGGMSLAVLFSLATAGWIWTFEETKGKRIEVL